MKNEIHMEYMLKERGYLKDPETNEWKKKDWVIRKRSKNIEVFNDPVTKNRCKYLCTGLNEEDFKQVLEEIEELG